MSKSFSTKEVSQHNTEDNGLYIIIDNGVYEMARERLELADLDPRPAFVNEHPGGAKILKRVGGKDASKQFWKYHNEGILTKYQRLRIGDVKEEAKL